nr:hypothetical protein KitaXyl93_17570 [Kitasatospora sp. Xyl93]
MVKSFWAGGAGAGWVAERARPFGAALTCGFIKALSAVTGTGRAPAHPLRRGWRGRAAPGAVVRRGGAQVTGQMALDTRRRSTWSRPTRVVPALGMARDSHGAGLAVH